VARLSAGFDIPGEKAMLRQEKEQVVAELVDRLKSTDTLIVADYRGLTVSEIGELRDRLVEAGARFSVVKNTLTKLAAEQAEAKDLLELIDGPTAIAFIEPEGDPVATAKVLSDVAKTRDVLVIRGGLLDGKPITDADVKSLSKLPPEDVLRGQLVGALAGSLTTVVGLFTAPLRDLVNVIEARIKQLEAEAPAAEAVEAEEPEQEPEAEAEAPEPEAEAEAEASEDQPEEEQQAAEEEQDDGN
jgi:large subunit ribosomal protein L10